MIVFFDIQANLENTCHLYTEVLKVLSALIIEVSLILVCYFYGLPSGDIAVFK